MARAKQWVLKTRVDHPEPPEEAEKQATVAACEAFINNVL